MVRSSGRACIHKHTPSLSTSLSLSSAYTHIRTHISRHTRTNTRKHTHTHTHTRTHIHTHTHTYTHTHTQCRGASQRLRKACMYIFICVISLPERLQTDCLWCMGPLAAARPRDEPWCGCRQIGNVLTGSILGNKCLGGRSL